MNQSTYVIEFENISKKEANRYAGELRDILLATNSGIEVKQKRSDLESQDFGATLVLVLGTPAVVAIVEAISEWMIRRNSVELTIKTDSEEILLRNITAKDAHKILSIFKNTPDNG
jgi:hypothetical protein